MGTELGVGFVTLMLAEAVPPEPASFDVTAAVVLFCVPNDVPITFTENVQLALPANVRPDRESELDPAVATIVPAPQLFAISPLGVDITKPDGKESVKPIPVRGPPVFGLMTVKLKLVVPPIEILAAPKLLVRVGGFG
jgi:hypothetical protein